MTNLVLIRNVMVAVTAEEVINLMTAEVEVSTEEEKAVVMATKTEATEVAKIVVAVEVMEAAAAGLQNHLHHLLRAAKAEDLGEKAVQAANLHQEEETDKKYQYRKKDK